MATGRVARLWRNGRESSTVYGWAFKILIFTRRRLKRTDAHWCEKLFSHGHPESELVVFVEVIDLGGEDEVQPDVEALLEVGGDDAVVVNAAANSALAQDVIVSHARLCATLVPVPQEIARQHRLLANFGAIRERQQPSRGDLPGGDGFVIRVSRREPDPGLALSTQIETFPTQGQRRRDALQVVHPVKLSAPVLQLRLVIQTLEVGVKHHLRKPRLLGRLQLQRQPIAQVILHPTTHSTIRQNSPHEHVILIDHVCPKLVRRRRQLDNLPLRRHLHVPEKEPVAQEELLIQLFVIIKPRALEQIRLQRHHHLSLHLLVLHRAGQIAVVDASRARSIAGFRRVRRRFRRGVVGGVVGVRHRRHHRRGFHARRRQPHDRAAYCRRDRSTRSSARTRRSRARAPKLAPSFDRRRRTSRRGSTRSRFE